MKFHLIVVFLLSLGSISFGQKISPLPTSTASPEQTRIKDFGSSLKKYEKKKPHNAQTRQKSKTPNDSDTIRVQTDLVVSNVLVTDQKSNVITNLKKDDFVVSEDGMPQTTEIFSSGERPNVPRSIVLVVNCNLLLGPYLKKSIEAAKNLVDKLNPSDKMAILTNFLKPRLDFTQDKTLLKNTLDSLTLEPYGEFDTLLIALNEMFDEKDRERIVIFQSAGESTIWLKPDKDSPYPVSSTTRYNSGAKWISEEKAMYNFGFGDVKEAVERSGATIYSVILGIRFVGLSKKEQLEQAKITRTETAKFYGWKNTITEQLYAEAERKTAGQTAMFKIAEWSGGNAGLMEKPEDATNIYSDIFTVIKNRYVIGYYSTNQNRDGSRRNIKIEVRNHPEYTVTGRKAYFASAEEK